MPFRWLPWSRPARRARLLQKPFPAEWENVLTSNVRLERFLSERQRARLRRLTQIFVSEKNWEGCGGLQLTDEIRVTIAAQASLLVVGMDDDQHFDHVLSVLVYPTGYVAPETEITRAGVVIDHGEPRLGEAWWRGPVVLSWTDVLAGGRLESPGQNLVFHEFAHQLDMLNGQLIDGTPTLADRGQLTRWTQVMSTAYEQLVQECRRHRGAFMDCYGAKNPAEFFAVATESFFGRPARLRGHQPELYNLLQSYYRLDPGSWKEPGD